MVSDVLYFRMELPVQQKRMELDSTKVDIHHCENGTRMQAPVKLFANDVRANTIYATVGQYKSTLLNEQICVNVLLSDGTEYKLIDFVNKHTQEGVGKTYNIFDQYSCFAERDHSVRHMSVTTACNNITVTWVNHAFDQYWFIRGQSVTINEMRDGEIRSVTPPYKIKKLSNPEHVLRMRNLESETDYLVCITTDYGFHGEKDKCQHVMTHCSGEPWVQIAIMIGCGVIAVLCVGFFLKVSVKRRMKQRKLQHDTDQCRACEDVRCADEYDLIEPLHQLEHVHEYFEIKNFGIPENQDAGLNL